VFREAVSPPAPADETPAGPRPADIPRFTHDLNNIFTVIYASVDLAMRPEIASPDRRNTLMGAQKAARDGAAIVTRIRQAIGREPIVAPARAAAASASSKSERLLVVSGDLATRLLLRAVLAYRGYEVTEAPDMNVAQQRLGEGVFNLAIVDLEGSGGAWQPIAERIPVLLLAQEPPAGAITLPWVRKPFENAELVARARALLDGSAGKRPAAQE
jgi:hypothetical protein